MPDGTNYRDIKLNKGRSAHNEIAIVYGTSLCGADTRTPKRRSNVDDKKEM